MKIFDMNHSVINDEWTKDPVYKPTQFGCNMDLDTWWKRFELYVFNARIPLRSLRSCLLVFLNDECMSIFDYCTPQIHMSLPELYQQMKKLFGKIEPVNIDEKGKFYNRRQHPNENVKEFFQELWRLAKIAFQQDPTIFNVDAMVRDRFINGLNDPYLMMQLTSKKLESLTSFQALDTTVELVNKLVSWKTNSQNAVLPSAPSPKQVSFTEENRKFTSLRSNLPAEGQKLCHFCKRAI